jgi:ABC-type Zn uptake system ZnuABC Zn-binding protein ZnuA
VRRGARWVRTVALAGVAVLVASCGAAPVEPGGAADTPAASPAERAEEEGTSGGDADEADTTEEPVLQLVATLAPLTDLVARVGGERVHVLSLVPPGADSHTYEPRPQDVTLLAEADAYLGVGLDLNDGVVGLAEQHLPADAPVLLLGELALGTSQLVLDHTHDGGHSHGGDGHTHGDDGHHDDDHSHEDDGLGPNPHVWTSVRNAIVLVDAIADELSTLDPEGEERYAANVDALVTDLEALDEDIATAIATVPEEHRTLVTYHDAWTYFARDHELEFITAVQPGDYAEPSAAEVRQVIDLVRDLGVPAIFGSEVFPSRVVDTIAAETGAVYVGDLADDDLPGAPGDDGHSYLELMRRNAITIVDALGGDSSGLAR